MKFRNGSTYFQDPATTIMEGIIDLHNYIFFYAIGIMVFVLCILLFFIYSFYYKTTLVLEEDSVTYRYLLMNINTITHNTTAEIAWTSIPSFILLSIAAPSFALLYAMDNVDYAVLVIKTIGHQWYWSYEYSQFTHRRLMRNFYDLVWRIEVISFKANALKFDSYMTVESELVYGRPRLLQTDNPVVIPINVPVRVLVTSTDVLHSWAVPSFGIKIDAVPGRLNQIQFLIKRSGTFYGQCSEICGVNHGFMPITVKAVMTPEFILFAKSRAPFECNEEWFFNSRLVTEHDQWKEFLKLFD